MTIYILKEILSNQYNRSDEARYNRAIVFVIQNTINGNLALFQLDRMSKKVAALRCNNRSCGHRLSIEHSIPTEAFGKQKGRKIASEVTKADLLDLKNWFNYSSSLIATFMPTLSWLRLPKTRACGLPSCWKDVCLVQDVVPVPLGGDLDEDVEACGALLDEDLPPPVVVLLPLQPVHLHLVKQSVGPQNVVALFGVVPPVALRPVRLAGAGKAHHQQHLALLPGRRGQRTSHQAVSRTQLGTQGER